MKVSDQHWMSLSLGATAVGSSATAVRQSKRAGQSIWGYVETTQQGMLALTQASGGIAFSVVPFHSAYTYIDVTTTVLNSP